MLILSHATTFGLYLLSLTLPGPCQRTGEMCEMRNNHDNLPVDLVVAFVFSITATPMIVKCRHTVAVVVTIFIEFIFLMTIAVRVGVGKHILAFIALLVVGQFVVLQDYESYTRRVYLNMSNIESSVKQEVEANNQQHLLDMQSKEMRALIANCAHDLKSPLAALSLELDTLQSIRTPTADNVYESASVMRGIYAFMSMIVSRAIDFKKVSSGIPLRPTLGTINLRRTVSWVVRCVGKGSRDVPIIVEDLPDTICEEIISDKQWFTDNLLCLVSNAQKFTDKGSVTIRFSIERVRQNSTLTAVLSYLGRPNGSASESDSEEKSSERERAMLRVSVEDTGIGVSPDMHKDIFRGVLQAGRESGGTGLGLFALARRVEALGGSYGVNGWDNGLPGAKFWFCIPYCASPISSRSMSWSTHESAWTSSRSIGIVPRSIQGDQANPDPCVRVLLVEDSVMIQKATACAFKREGLHVHIANNGAECLAMLQRHTYDLIVMDIQMPVMDGLEATRRIREHEGDEEAGWSHPAVTIVGLSANCDSESAHDALVAGMNDYLPKPLSMRALKESCVKLRCNVFSSRESTPVYDMVSTGPV
eukprot:CAMPEP_0185028026 /NCGR_PEP_ID=MMETSP1103-20130426/13440_1 /TAXON_ID=36769 /ORGANISM="Paraphysomonas bandaiensis, Strain Caron Lab Isolate" /LENGTH=589 /DNA_ID=CAMNT_0027562255 /DNA_START=611 /DNA_END=2380 /DNA_ORIENTATION=-